MLVMTRLRGMVGLGGDFSGNFLDKRNINIQIIVAQHGIRLQVEIGLDGVGDGFINLIQRCGLGGSVGLRRVAVRGDVKIIRVGGRFRDGGVFAAAKNRTD